jgi:hypothetical protein
MNGFEKQTPEGRLGDGEGTALRAYLAAVMAALSASPPTGAEGLAVEEISERVFEALTGRDFCYLSKIQVARYRTSVLAQIRGMVRAAEPIRFYYDLGAGYHATTHPGEEELCFDVGLAELLVMRQVRSFSARVRAFYPPGVTFSIVIDNMAALLINDIDTAKTLRYCRQFREMIRHLGLDTMVELLVESEHFSVADFDRVGISTACQAGNPVALTREQHANVERFLGRPCDEVEAIERAARYRAVIETSERLLDLLIQGVHMTQRATDTTICFRPFPGGDSRIQCGEVALTQNAKGAFCPILLTSHKVKAFSSRRYRFPGLLPPMIPHVTYAERINGTHP